MAKATGKEIKWLSDVAEINYAAAESYLSIISVSYTHLTLPTNREV